MIISLCGIEPDVCVLGVCPRVAVLHKCIICFNRLHSTFYHLPSSLFFFGVFSRKYILFTLQYIAAMLYSIKCCKLNICLNIDKSTVVCCCRCAHVAHVYARPRMSYLWGARYESLGKFSLTSIFYNVVRTERVGDASVSRARVEVRACMSEQCYCAVKLMLSFVFTPHPFSVSLSPPPQSSVGRGSSDSAVALLCTI